jgi:hypothetical protein
VTDLFPNAKPAVSLAGQIAEVERELAMRRAVYPRWVAAGRVKQDAADARVIAMEAVLATLRGLPR